ncbi:MAG: dihydropteroate synthase [Candidatus Korobacteraceae bacterium]
MRQTFQWKLGARALELGRRTLIMGVVNVTPDSFSDGGEFLDREKAVERALQLLAEGADILDLGGESTRPGAAVFAPAGAKGTAAATLDTSLAPETAAVSPQQEQDRVLPVIEAIKRERPEAVVSIDTYKSGTAMAALRAGAEIVNDVSGLMWDPAMAGALAGAGCGMVLMHTRGTPAEWNSLPPEPELPALVLRGLANSAGLAVKAGVARERIVLDPGFGFGKRFDENYPLLAHLERFADLGYPLLAGVSRKGFLSRTVAARLAELGLWQPTPEKPILPAQERLFGTLAAVVAAVLKGAHIVRVHDVRAAVEATAVADAVLAAGSW